MSRQVSEELLARAKEWVKAHPREPRPADCAAALRISTGHASQVLLALGFSSRKRNQKETAYRVQWARALRNDGHSRREIAEALGVSKTAVTMMLRGDWGN